MLWLAGLAFAAEPQPWVTEWYGRPRGNVRAVSVNGVTSAQAVLGAEGKGEGQAEAGDHGHSG